jgi:hypothetical protein
MTPAVFPISESPHLNASSGEICCASNETGDLIHVPDSMVHFTHAGWDCRKSQEEFATRIFSTSNEKER